MKKIIPISVISLVLILVVSYMVFGGEGKNDIESIVSEQQTDGIGSNSESAVPTTVSGSKYIDYSTQSYDSNSGKRRVLFFHAKWCPTCKTANTEFEANVKKIPEDVVLLKTDYDTFTDLKKKYAITYQHTFVQVDEQGNEVTKWNGGGIDELLANIK